MEKTISTDLLKRQIKRLLIIAELSMVGYIAFVILPLYTAGTSTDGRGWVPTHLQMNMFISLMSMRNIFMVSASVVTPFLITLLLFSSNYQNSGVDELRVRSISKKQLFCTNMLVGLILLLVPLVILSFILLIPIKTPMWGGVLPDYLFPWGLSGANGITINTLPIVAGFFARTTLVFMFYFTMFMMAISITYKRWLAKVLFLLQPLVLFLLLGSTFVIEIIYFIGPSFRWQFFSFGQSATNIWEHLLYILIYTHPIGWMFAFGGWDSVSSPLHLYPFFISYIAIEIFMVGIIYIRLRPKPDK